MNRICFLILSCILFFTGCNKSSKECWQAFDPTMGDVTGLVVCNKSKSEAEQQYPQYWFYKTKEAKYCWDYKLGGNHSYYLRNIPQSIVEKTQPLTGGTYEMVDCNSFCMWTKILERKRSKVTNEYSPTGMIIETFNADSCSKLFVGRVVVYNETTDSITTREFLEKSP